MNGYRLEEVEITWKRAASVWWAIAWRTVVAAIVVGVALNWGWMLLLMAMDLGRKGMDKAEGVRQLIAALLNIPIGIYIVKYVLGSHVGDAKLTLVRQIEEVDA